MFGSSQKYRVSKNQKNLLENINWDHIYRIDSAQLRFSLGNQTYMEWGIKSECCDRIMLIFYYQAIFKEYGLPKSTLTKYLWNIHPLFKFSNSNALKSIVETGEASLYTL